MKISSSLTTVGAILIAAASLSYARTVPQISSSTEVSFLGDALNCLDRLCDNDRSGYLKARAGTHSSGAGAAAGAARIPPVVAAPGSVGAGGARRPLPESEQGPGAGSAAKNPRPNTPPEPEPLAETSTVLKDPTRPPGLDGTLESTLWKDMTARINDKKFTSLKEGEELALYTGKPAWNAVERFGEAFEGANPGRPLRHYLNTIKSDTTLQGLIEAYEKAPGRQKWTLPNGVASTKLVMMTRERSEPVHILFSTPEEAAAAIRGEIPKGHLKYYELYPITSAGTKVPRIYAWDEKTWDANLKNKDYQPPQIWEQGQPPLGKPVDFSVDSRKRTD